MCGIVAAAARREVSEILLEGLRRLEYPVQRQRRRRQQRRSVVVQSNRAGIFVSS